MRVALAVAALVAAACGGGGAPAPESLVLVTIDTLRADHLGTYGYARPTSPAIDRIARDSTVFENAVATCPATAPSVATILTGLHRASHGVLQNGMALRATVRTLAEALHDRGYRTAAVVANAVIDRRGFEQGFDTFTMPAAVRAPGPRRHQAAHVLAQVEAVLDRLEPPFFLWVHFMDPHGPYVPPEEQRAAFPRADYRRPGDPRLPLATANYGLGVIPRYQRVGGRRMPADYRARYDAEIRYTDDHVARLVDALRARGFWERALFVLTADHGESLGEHDYWFQHGWHVYEGSVRVPLVIHAPGVVPAGRRVPQTASLVDLAPTLLALLGAGGADGMEGRSLLPLVRGEEGDRPAPSETYYGNRLASVRLGRWKFIQTPPPPPPTEDHRSRDGWLTYWPREGREELYDLGADPDEERNLIATETEIATDLRRIVHRRPATDDAVPPGVPPDPTLERELRALGYAD